VLLVLHGQLQDVSLDVCQQFHHILLDFGEGLLSGLAAGGLRGRHISQVQGVCFVKVF
jgi:hypothetical protein